MNNIWLYRWQSGGLDHFPFKPMERDHHHADEFKQYIRADEYFRLEERLTEAEEEVHRLKALINDHNQECIENCETVYNQKLRGCPPIPSRCSECPKDWFIELEEGE